MIHLVLPMAGKGSRFLAAGYEVPKPLINVGDWRMFEIVLANIWSPLITRVTLVCQKEVADQVDASWLAEKLGADVRLKVLSETTNGPATTVALALDGHESGRTHRLIVANTDQYVDTDVSLIVRGFLESGNHLILGMEAHDPKWSFVRINEDSREVLLVKEKDPISKFATCGIYMFRSEEQFLAGFRRMNDAGDFTNGELYVAPIYNYLESVPTEYVNLGEVDSVFHGLGTPEDLERFLKSPVLDKATSKTREVFS